MKVFNNFRKKYQISFVLKDLFTDIYWNCIFHNEMLSNKFINIYIGNDNVSTDIRKILSEIINIISNVSIPLKTQIMKLLQIKHLEDKDDIDLITCIVKEKNKNRNLVKNENIINNVNKS